MSDRGMKKWAPYASLIEQKGTMARMLHDKKKVTRPHISGDKAAIIERILIEYHGQRLAITYFDKGFIHTCEDIIVNIDTLNRRIFCENVKIDYRDILEIDE